LEVQVIKRRFTPRQKERRDHIVACAQDLLRKNGAAISMEAVAEASGTSRSTLYRNFSSREHLIAEVTLDAGNRLIEYLEQHPPRGDTFGGRIESLCFQISRLGEANDSLLASCVTNIISEDPAVIDSQAVIEELVGRIFRTVRGESKTANQAMVDKAIFRYLLGGFILTTTGKLSYDALASDLTELCRTLMSEQWQAD
jgi:TetR/AcrR family transcriptional regulator, cholesterol catabolism regulator